MKLSVVILNYNVRYFLEQCIRSVQQAIQNIDAEIIVIDNASSDDSCVMVKQQFPTITLIENTENVGFSTANNQAVAVATGDYVCILNPDTAVTHQVFEDCLRFAASSSEIGAIGIQYQDGTGHFLPESKRNLPTPWRSLMKLLGYSRGKYGYYAKHLLPSENGEVAVLAGAFMFMSKSVYKQVGGFDEDYFMYGEDIDLSYKITKAGFKNYYLGSQVLLHYKGESTQKDKAYLDRFYGAMTLFYGKHFNTNFILNAAVKIGVAVTKALRMRSLKKAPSPELMFDEVWVVTEDLTLLKKLSEHYSIPVKSVALRAVEEDIQQHKLLVFDTHFLSYATIFKIMKLQKDANCFRIRPPNCNFILGSDQSDSKGEVLVLN